MRRQGFTMIELLVAMAIIATLLSLAAPKYFNNLERTREAVLRENLYLMRDAIDKYYTDKGTYLCSTQDRPARPHGTLPGERQCDGWWCNGWRNSSTGVCRCGWQQRQHQPHQPSLGQPVHPGYAYHAASQAGLGHGECAKGSLLWRQ